MRFLLFLSAFTYIGLLSWIFLLPKKHTSIFITICGIALLIFITVYFGFAFVKYYRNLFGLSFEKKDSFVFLNKRKICKEIELKAIVIQPKEDFSPVPGMSASIGLQIADKAIPVLFEYSPTYVKRIAEIMSEYFQCSIVEKPVMNLGMFSKW